MHKLLNQSGREFARFVGAQKIKTALWQFALTVLCSLFAHPARAIEPEKAIRGVTARSQAVNSGRIQYAFKSEGWVKQKALDPIKFTEVAVSFSDSSWAERARESSKVRINHDGYYLEFVRTPQRNGSVRPGVTLYPPRSLETRAELNAPPIFAGSFWYPEQRRYVERHGSRFRTAGSSRINQIDVEVLELDVPAAEYREAFHVLAPELKGGGLIRLCVAPSLGYVLPRIEFVTTAGKAVISYDAMDFSEAAPGIYFPQRIWMETRAVDDSSRSRGEFTIRAELINQAVPAEDFVVELPVGTHVQDARDPTQVVKFDLSEGISTATLNSRSFGSELQPPHGALDRWRNAVIVGAAIGTLASIGLFYAARHQRSYA